MLNDTITAIATPSGSGGISVLRISGPSSVAIASLVFRPISCEDLAQSRGYRVYYGHVVQPHFDGKGDPVGKPFEIIDDALLTVFRAPRSYTGEDVCEVSVHGGQTTARSVLNIIVLAGARLAEPGEFTKRAFMNGRLDLAQAEAVSEVIKSRTDAARRMARRQLEGALSRKVAAIRDDLIGITAAIEVTIDFSDDVGELDHEEILARLEIVRKEIVLIKDCADRGRALREGVTATIVGRPNTGKSSLMNALLRSDRAIVTAIAGTTRDTIEESFVIEGVPFVITDTAGVRETADPIERIGVERTRSAAAVSDIALLVLDLAAGFTVEDEAVLEFASGSARSIVVWNKVDIVANATETLLGRNAQLPAQLRVFPSISVSALTGSGILSLEAIMAEPYVQADGMQEEAASPILSQARHVQAIDAAVTSLEHALTSARRKMPGDFITLDIRGALDSLGLITGETVTDDIIDRIFRDFCVGK